MKLVVVVVFDDRDPLAARQGEKGQAARRLQRHRGRILMMGRDVDGAQFGAARQPLQRSDVHPLAVHGNGDEGRSGGAKRFPRRAVAELLDGDGIAGTEQRPGHQRQRHLAAARHDHVAGPDRQPSGAGEHRGQRRAQRDVPLRIAVGEQVGASQPEHAAVGAAEQPRGDEPDVGSAAAQIQRAARQARRQIGCRRLGKRERQAGWRLLAHAEPA
jgi:hypothetical protein